MKKRVIACGIWVLAAAVLMLTAMPISAEEPTAARSDETVTATPALVREIQFMLLTVGVDPGPIDGNAQQLTNRAAHIFQARAGLPISDVSNTGPISVAFVERLRQEAAKVMFKAPAPAPPPPVAVTPPVSPPAVPPAPRPPPPDRFASCPFTPQDFHVGGKQYTAQNFLDDGFGGSTARAVTNLRNRLDEARQLAERIGGAALLEVQRQARVLAYFECRLKIEQDSGKS
jgi:peptidoglycan hydrolase-like protein with peptidoglycan-binding domain